MLSTRNSEWLPQFSHFIIFVLAHKNANEPTGVLPPQQNSGETPVAVALSVVADAIPLLVIRSRDNPLAIYVLYISCKITSVTELKSIFM
jgi:hypothetical protein